PVRITRGHPCRDLPGRRATCGPQLPGQPGRRWFTVVNATGRHDRSAAAAGPEHARQAHPSQAGATRAQATQEQTSPEQARGSSEQASPYSGAIDPGAPLAWVVRGDLTESVHTGHLVALSAEGAPALQVGSPEQVMYPRSSIKPVQALAALRTGVPLSSEQIA